MEQVKNIIENIHSLSMKLPRCGLGGVAADVVSGKQRCVFEASLFLYFYTPN